MSFELFIAIRYLFARRKQAFISMISLISTMGVAVGVMALVIALALMTGLQRELRDRILGSTAHVYVWKTGGIQDYLGEVQKLRRIDGHKCAIDIGICQCIANHSPKETITHNRTIDTTDKTHDVFYTEVCKRKRSKVSP